MTNPMFTDLSLLLNPNSVVLVGASNRIDSIGGRALANLVDESDFHGELFLVNPTTKEINGRTCFPSVTALPSVPDLAVIAVPAGAVMAVLEECADKGVRFVILFTAGFGEVGAEGKLLEAQMKNIVRRSGMRIYGPNCPGLSNINKRLGFTFSPAFKLDLQSGPVGITTQGGGLGRSFLQGMERGIGVGLWATPGNEVDLEISDFIYYMAEAPDIKVIVVSIEGVRDGRKFIAAVQHAARKGKPLIALKIGKSDYGIKAAQSHTASIAGSAEVNSAVFRQLGIVEVDDVDEMIDTAWLFARAMPKGDDQVAIYCSSGGTAALTADMVGTAGVKLTKFAPETLARLGQLLPSFAAVDNPVDTTAEVLTNPGIVDTTLKAVTDDPGVSLVLLPFPFEYGKASTLWAESAVRVQVQTSVPLLAVWMSDRLGAGYDALVKARMVPARSVGKAAKAVRRWIEYGQWRKQYDATYVPLLMQSEPHIALKADTGSNLPVDSGRTMVESEAKAWLAQSSIPVLASATAASREEARRIADRIGYPVVAKIASLDITHKSDVGGVALGLNDGDAVDAAWDRIHAAVKQAKTDARIDGLLIERMANAGGVETLIGVHRDPIFGHMLTFGLGGIYVEIFKDVTRRLLPLTPQDAAAMIREVRCFPLLDGARGRPPCDVEALTRLLLAVSDFVVANAARIEEIDLNPVWVGARGQGAIPLDAVIVVNS
jgi:acyl-CoA synthetase (NDP forming)